MAIVAFNTCINVVLKTNHIPSQPGFCNNVLHFERDWFGLDTTAIGLYTNYPSKLVCYIDHKIGLDGVEE